MIDELLNKYTLISDQVTQKELRIILNYLKNVSDNEVPGEIVEMGCYLGTTSLFITRLLKQLQSNKKFHVYDSFEGLPEKTHLDSSPAGTQFKSGELRASKSKFIENYKKANLVLPIIHKSWFKELNDKDVPSKISFAFLDGDYYESIMSCLKLIENRLVSSSVVIIDDYLNEALPGAKKAVDEWANIRGFDLKTEQSLAIIKIPKH